MTTNGYDYNRHQEATIKMFIAQINLLSFGTIFLIVATIIFAKISGNSLI